MKTASSTNQNIEDSWRFNGSFNPKSKFNKENYESIDGNWIHKTAIINWERVKLGKGNAIGPYSCIGTEPPNVSEVSNGFVEIGDANNICEYVTIHLPTQKETGTVLGNNNILMSSAHIGHDCILEDNIVLCNNAAVAGNARIMSGATLALNASVHQFKLIGSWAIVGMNSCVNKSTRAEPGRIYFGVPARDMGWNVVGLNRNNISKGTLNEEIARYESMIGVSCLS